MALITDRSGFPKSGLALQLYRVFGSWALAACPQRRVAAGLVMPAANAGTMSLHLTAIGCKAAAGSPAALVLDGAGYHIAAALTIPQNVTLLRLPPYAPELNPIANIWEYLPRNKPAITVSPT